MIEITPEINHTQLENGLMQCCKNGKIEDIVQWFKTLDGQFKGLLEANKVTDTTLMELSEFIYGIDGKFGPGFLDMVDSYWEGEPPVLMTHVNEFGPEYSKHKLEEDYARLDAVEKKEAESLFREIWDRKVRADINCGFYDWDEDVEKSISYTLPKLDRSMAEMELKRLCANVIYNRGNMIIRFYARRGMFEIAAIKAYNGTGEWENFSDIDFEMCFENGIAPNETIIQLKTKSQSAPAEKGKRLLYMPS